MSKMSELDTQGNGQGVSFVDLGGVLYVEVTR